LTHPKLSALGVVVSSLTQFVLAELRTGGKSAFSDEESSLRRSSRRRNLSAPAVFLVAGEEEAVAGGVGTRSVDELGSCWKQTTGVDQRLSLESGRISMRVKTPTLSRVADSPTVRV
jgi:hypothetical protein